MIHWPAGGRLALHDHGGSNGALFVQRGQLREHTVTGGPLPRPPPAARRVPVGAFGGTDIHDVVNASRRTASSVHAYSPPMPSMTFYRLGRTGLSVERTDYRCDPTWAP